MTLRLVTCSLLLLYIYMCVCVGGGVQSEMPTLNSPITLGRAVEYRTDSVVRFKLKHSN